ncbi:uncharacterized protein LOC114270608 [Camellia sinensis]|uniref:uncharacterized protein LOC114270608 n=1 Tax=Camellia sinensis TaxID=4442 RepID=UPI00103645F7|nr:uncharacterized protein LOC114270608 [Camellia sinensis]
MPFLLELDMFEALKKFNILRFQIYYGKSDPNFPVGLYLNSMALWSGNEQLLCKEGLAEMFMARFVTNMAQPLRVDSLLALKISDGEGLKAYAKRYYKVYNRILACNQELAVVSFKNGLDDNCPRQKSLAKTLPKSMEELMSQIEKYARAKKETQGKGTPKQEGRNGSLKRDRGNTGIDQPKIGMRTM